MINAFLKDDNFGSKWSMWLGAVNAIQVPLLDKYKKMEGFNCSLAKYLDQNIFAALDPDRVHNDNLPHINNNIKAKISRNDITGCVPLSPNDSFEYKKYYLEEIPENGYFDGFGLYYYPWPGNPEYNNHLSPLENVKDFETIYNYPMPIIKEEDIDVLKEDVKYLNDLNKISSAYSGSLYEWSYMLRGREKFYFDYYDHPEIAKAIIKKVADFVWYLTSKNIESGINILCYYDDFGTQQSLQINPEIFREYYKPYYKEIWGKIKSKYSNVRIFLHSCGNIEKIIPDLIDCGLDIINPLQPEAINLNVITREYSKYLIFWGTMSNQYTLTRGSKSEIFKEVVERINNIGKYSRLILAPSNILGVDVPEENINYFRDACLEFI
jgi:uroporphyrinogen decarboxylase